MMTDKGLVNLYIFLSSFEVMLNEAFKCAFKARLKPLINLAPKL